MSMTFSDYLKICARMQKKREKEARKKNRKFQEDIDSKKLVGFLKGLSENF